ncbi:Protein bicaudal C 1 [Portunus trituberculatus]|uniref:Protein bicaudal C 1 n=1 Tax=Portunus trituberculatus TaxID=210409 RepID=A0A5B7GCR0_PORTR|nr:Protein bicaudal C 1 [Portunus trituberculatus]
MHGVLVVSFEVRVDDISGWDDSGGGRHDVFLGQEVDLKMFLSLEDYELKELGITIFGHRKRILMAIKGGWWWWWWRQRRRRHCHLMVQDVMPQAPHLEITDSPKGGPPHFKNHRCRANTTKAVLPSLALAYLSLCLKGEDRHGSLTYHCFNLEPVCHSCRSSRLSSQFHVTISFPEH